MRSYLIPLALFPLAVGLIALGLSFRAAERDVLTELHPPPSGVTMRYQTLTSPDDIVDIEGPLVPPITYTGLVSLADLPVDEKKEKFFALMLPAVLIAKRELADLRDEVTRIAADPAPSREDNLWLDAMLEQYRADDTDDLLVRLADHPNSVILAQAALESGWGTSRFFRKGNNVFGVWSFDEAEPRMVAGETRGDRAIHVKRYRSLLGSIEDYFVLIGRGPYSDFRQARLQGDRPLQLIQHLERYSELGDEYIRRLALTIRSNQLQRFDDHRLATDLLAMEGS